MHITIHYYAILREQRGCDAESWEASSSSLHDLYRELQEAFHFTLPAAHVRPAVNDEFCAWDRPIADGDRVVFVPPVAGG
jgi:sulfur-carrier protein